jgi:hypothetical protein
MASLTRPDGEIYFDSYGEGYPVSLFAPGGLLSRVERWHALDGGVS